MVVDTQGVLKGSRDEKEEEKESKKKKMMVMVSSMGVMGHTCLYRYMYVHIIPAYPLYYPTLRLSCLSEGRKAQPQSGTFCWVG